MCSPTLHFAKDGAPKVCTEKSGPFDCASRDESARRFVQDDNLKEIQTRFLLLCLLLRHVALLEGVVDEQADADGQRDESGGGDNEHIVFLDDPGK